jgi:ribosomal protein S18 acetylase RimI-like enzyme
MALRSSDPVSRVGDGELYERGAATLLASWQAYARGSDGAEVLQLEGVAAAVFPREPERSFFNNALVARGLPPGECAVAVTALERAYRATGVERYAAWAHESDEGLRAELSARGYRIAESTRAMGLSLGETAVPRPGLALDLPDWPRYLRALEAAEAPAGLLAGVDPHAFRSLAAAVAGEDVASALAFDHERDCGIFNVSTAPAARRQGLGTALTARLLHDAAERGCTTASLHSTPMAERMYAACGFRDLGRILEYVPS